MQQVYGTSSPAAAASYVSPASSFYNTASYPYPSLSSTRSLNPSCKSGSGYLSSPYSSPSSPFQSASHPQTSQYSAYAGYNTPGTSTFAQSFCTQVGNGSSNSSVMFELVCLIFFYIGSRLQQLWRIDVFRSTSLTIWILCFSGLSSLC